LPSRKRFNFSYVAVNLKHGAVTEQLHSAVDNDFAAIPADVTQLAGPGTLTAQLRYRLREFPWEFGLQQGVADAPDSLIRWIAV